jgi:hypothetical protein
MRLQGLAANIGRIVGAVAERCALRAAAGILLAPILRDRSGPLMVTTGLVSLVFAAFMLYP